MVAFHLVRPRAFVNGRPAFPHRLTGLGAVTYPRPVENTLRFVAMSAAAIPISAHEKPPMT
jgi:hypothetical protein